MQSTLVQHRHLILTTLFLTCLLTSFYLFYTPSQTTVQRTVQKKPTQPITLCDQVDAAWLASDRIYWDGWQDKAMFMKRDGTLTRGNVYIEQDQDVCIVVLLGPTPAKASIKDEQNDHIGPRDSIVMFASGQYTKKTIQLNQHTEQSNVYMAAVHFSQPDTYELNASTEYRHFFWETPILHAYHPFRFQSQNKLIVQPSKREAKKTCNATSLEGTWIDQAKLAEYDPYMLHQMYENTENQHSVVNKVFVPDTCQLNYVSLGKVAECLGRQTVHVWADQHIKRNLQALDQPDWCDLEAIAELDDPEVRNAAFRCDCNEIGEDPTWWKDSAQPLILENSLNVNARFYVHSLKGALVSERDRFVQQMELANHTDQADWVIVGIGNDDIEALQVTPKQFEAHLIRFFEQLRKIYPHQRVIVRTPQYFCCSTREGSSWNTGRSLAMTVAMRQVVQDQPNMVLWDVHQLGTDETGCFLTQGSTYSKRHVVNTENQFLWRLLCLA